MDNIWIYVFWLNVYLLHFTCILYRYIYSYFLFYTMNHTPPLLHVQKFSELSTGSSLTLLFFLSLVPIRPSSRLLWGGLKTKETHNSLLAVRLFASHRKLEALDIWSHKRITKALKDYYFCCCCCFCSKKESSDDDDASLCVYIPSCTEIQKFMLCRTRISMI